MKYLLLIAFLFTSIIGYGNANKYYSSDGDKDSLKFIRFAKSYIKALQTGNTRFINKHTLYPIVNSDLGSSNDDTTISKEKFLANLKVFFDDERVALMQSAFDSNQFIDINRRLKNWSYGLIISKPNLDSENPKEYIRTDSWFFLKKGRKFMFYLYTLDQF